MEIDKLINEFTSSWNESLVTFPELGKEITADEKMRLEEEVSQYSNKAKTKIVKARDFLKGKDIDIQLKQNMLVFMKNAFRYESHEVKILSNGGFANATRDFINTARQFDSQVKMEDVFQALRNLWIVNSLQVLMNEPVKLSPSIFAYSMLYPYTDNYLDDPNISDYEKSLFSKKFGSRLKGLPEIPSNRNEECIFRLVSMIEQEWDRDENPLVYKSLLAIHNAQIRSIQLVGHGQELHPDKLLSICIEKGGTSVLADGYLIKGRMTSEQESFCFGFGAFLQFIDDLQDLDEDISGNLETMFSRAAKTGKLEEFTNRTLSFSDNVLKGIHCFSSPTNDAVHGLMQKSIYFMVIEAVGLNHCFFNTEYVKSFENYSPFSFVFLREKRQRNNPERISLKKRVEQYLFQEKHEKMELVF
jgi:hypothetical protein